MEFIYNSTVKYGLKFESGILTRIEEQARTLATLQNQ